MAVWQVNQARNQLSELLDQADEHGPQVITHHGKARSVVLSMKQFRALEARTPDLKTYLLQGPVLENFELSRDMSADRKIDL